MITTTEVVLYTSKTLSNGQHPVMLRLTKNRKRKYISLHISLCTTTDGTMKSSVSRLLDSNEKYLEQFV